MRRASSRKTRPAGVSFTARLVRCRTTLGLPADPRSLLLVDEASLGLAPIAVKNLMEQLRVIARERGTALIAVEQDASVALRLADRVYVIDRGETVWEGLSSQATAAGLARQYLGTAR